MLTRMTATVRAGREADIPALLDLATAFYDEDGFTTAREQLRPRLRVLVWSATTRVAVAEREVGELVGFAITTTTFGLECGLVAELEDLFVLPAQRGTGVGELLIADSETWAREREVNRLEVILAPNGNDIGRLHAYYLRHGFVDEGRRLVSRELD